MGGISGLNLFSQSKSNPSGINVYRAFKDPKEKNTFLSTMNDLGFTLTMDDTLESFLGIKFESNSDGSFVMTQPALIQKIIDATDMNDCNPCLT